MSTVHARWSALCWLATLTLSQSESSDDTISLPASCLGQEDGYQWLKPLDGDEYPVIHQKCSNEFMVIDVNEDSNVKEYFTSFQKWHYALGGPEAMDYSNWEQWWRPNAQFMDM